MLLMLEFGNCSSGKDCKFLWNSDWASQRLVNSLLRNGLVMCSWRSPECDFWKCNGNDHLHHGVAKEYDPSCTIIPSRLHSFQHATGSWMCILLWGPETFPGRSKVQQGMCTLLFL